MRASCAGPLASHGEAEVGQGQPRAGQGGEQVVEPGLLAVEPVEGDLELFTSPNQVCLRAVASDR